jgi:hypothetical protein
LSLLFPTSFDTPSLVTLDAIERRKAMKKYILKLMLLLIVSLTLIHSRFVPGATCINELSSLVLQPQFFAQNEPWEARQCSPVINVSTSRDSITTYIGSPRGRAAIKDNLARATALASGDYDEDGIADLISAHATPAGGFLILHRGNVRAIYPHSIEAARLKTDGSPDASPFFGPALIFEVVEAPDFLAGGDFDADGHWDVVTASSVGTSLYLFSGDGRGGFAPAKLFGLPGSVTHIVSGEVNRADGFRRSGSSSQGAERRQGARVRKPPGCIEL